MKRFLRPALLALAVLALAAAPAGACTMRGYPFRQWPGTVFVLGTALPDTVAVSANVAPLPGATPEPMRPPPRGTVYGQVVQVERFGGAAAAGLPGTTGRAVLVPWSTHGDCSPRRWEGSARWMEPGAHGVVVGRLRDRAEWVDGMPTFDVREPFAFPHPQRLAGRSRRPDAPPLLGAEEYFGVLELLPTLEQASSSAARAYAPLFAWAAREPELARAYPASAILEDAMWDTENERLRALSPEIAGTYRLEVTLGGGAPHVVYARTAAHPRLVHYRAGRRWDGGPVPADAYSIHVALAPSPDALPDTLGENPRVDRGVGVLWIREHAEAGGGERAWRAEIQFAATQPAAADPAIAGFLRDFPRHSYANRENADLQEPGRFVRRPDGSVVVEQAASLPDGRVLRIRGARISTVTVVETPAARAF